MLPTRIFQVRRGGIRSGLRFCTSSITRPTIAGRLLPCCASSARNPQRWTCWWRMTGGYFKERIAWNRGQARIGCILSTYSLHLQVLGRHQRCAVACLIVLLPELEHIGGQRGLSLGIQPGECNPSWPKVLTEDVKHLRRRERIVELSGLSRAANALDCAAEALPHHGLISPKHRSRQACGRRGVPGGGGKHPADKARRGPAGHGN